MSTNRVEFEIVLNGEKHSVSAGETVLGLIGTLGLDPERLAVEFDRRIVKRERWADTELAEGAEVELVMFVGGG